MNYHNSNRLDCEVMENLEETLVLHSSFCERPPAASRDPLPLAFLRILNGPGFAGKAFPLYEGETFIGRDASCGIHLPTSSMSRRHAAFDVQRCASRLRDLNSLNGTLCGGVRLQPGVSWSIRHGATLRFGDISSQFLLLQSSSDDYFTGDEDVDAATQPLDMLPYMTEDKGLEQTNANDSPGFAVHCGPLRCTNNGETISGGTAAVTTRIKGVTATAISQMNVDGGEGVRSVNGCNVPTLEGNVNVQHRKVQLKQQQGLILDKTPGTMASGLPLPLYVTESQESIISCSILPEPGLASSPVQTDCFTSPSITIVPDSEEDEDQEDAGMASCMLDQHSTPARRQPAIPNFISESDDTDLEGETGVFESTTDKATQQADYSLTRFQQSTSTQRGVPFHLDSDTDDELVGSNLEAVETSIQKSEGDQNDTDETEDDDDDVPMLRNLSALPNGGMSQVIPVQRSPCYLADEPTQQFLPVEKPQTTTYALVSDEATQKYELDDLENNGSVPVPRGISEEYKEPQALTAIPGSKEAIECPVGNQNLSIAAMGNHGMDVSTTIDKEINIVMNDEAQLSENHFERSIDPNVGEVTETQKITMKRELRDIGCTSLRECKKDHTDERQNPPKFIDHSVDESLRNMAVQLPQENDVTTVDPPEVDGPRRAAASETKDEEGTVDGAGVTQEEGGMHVEEVQVEEGNLIEGADIQAEVKKMDSITGSQRKEDSAVGGSWSGAEEGSGSGNHQGGGIKVSGDGGSRPQDEKNVHGDCGFQEAEIACAKEMQQVGSKEAKTQSNRGRGRRGRGHKRYDEDQWKQGKKQPHKRDEEVSTSLSENLTRERRMSLRGDKREANKDAIRVEIHVMDLLIDPRDVSNNDDTTPSKSYPVLQGLRSQGCGRGPGKNRKKTMSNIKERGGFALLGGEDGNVEETTSTKQHPSPEEFPTNSNLESVNELEDASAGSSNNETKSNVFKRDCGEQEETRMNLQAEHVVTSPAGQEKLPTNVHIESNVDRQENAETNAKSNLTDGVSKSARGPKAGLTKRRVLVGGKEVLNDCRMAEMNVLGQDEMQQVDKIRPGRLNIEAAMCTTRRASARLRRGILESDGAGIQQNQGHSAIPKSKRLANARNPTRENCDEYTASRESSGGAIVEHKSARDGSVEMVGKAGNTSTGLGTEKPSNTARQLRRTGTVNVINKGMRELMGKSEKCKNGRDFQNHDVISSSNKGNSDATSLQDVREEPVHKAEEKKDEKSVKDEDQGSDHCRSELEDPQEQQLRVESKDNVADGSHGVTGKCEAIEQDERTDSQVHIATNDLQSSPKNYGRGRRRKLPNVAKKTPGRRKKTTPEDAGHLLTSESGNFDRIADDDINVESISIEPTPPEDEVSGSEPDVLDLSISSSGTSACKSTTTQKRSGRQQQTSTNFEESMSGHVEQHGGKTRKSQRLGFDPEIPPDNVPTVKLKQLGPEDNEPHKGQIVPRVGEHHDDENSQHKPKNTQKSKVTKTKAGSLAVGDKMEGPDRRTLRKRTASEATITSTEQGPTTIHTMAGDFENVKVQRKNVDVENELNNSSCDTDLPDTLVSSSGSISESSETVCGERKEAKSNARGKKSPRDPQIANNCRRSRRFVSDELVALSSPDKSKVLVKTSQHVTRSRLDSLTFKVLFTGVLDDMGQEAVRKLGGSVTENPLEASHLVTDRVRRTVKFLCAVARGLPIVQPEWLKRSLRKKTILPEEDFLVQDTEAERRFDFCLQDSLAKARKEPCLQGMQVHVTCSVKPEPEYMSTIIKCAGGIFLPKMPHTLKDNVVIVSCEEDSSRWLPARQTGFLIASAELILTGVLRQSAQAASFLLSDDPQSQESPNSTVNSSLSDKQRSGAASKRCTNKRR